MAPAPSPNSTQVPRSFQSRMREKVSAPITSAVEAMPFLIRLSATDSAVDEARAHRLDVEGGALGHAEGRLHAGRGGGKGLVGRGGRQHDQVEVGRLHAGMVERALRGLDGEMRGELAVGRDVALLDAGTLLDPLVGRFDFLGQFVVA